MTNDLENIITTALRGQWVKNDETDCKTWSVLAVLFQFWYIIIPGVCVLYRKTSCISRTLVGNKIVDNSDVVGASPVGAAPTTSSFST